jgi:hypothetical protein
MTSFCGCEQAQVQPINIVRQSTTRLSLAIFGLARTLSPVDPQCRLSCPYQPRLDLRGCWVTNSTTVLYFLGFCSTFNGVGLTEVWGNQVYTGSVLLIRPIIA